MILSQILDGSLSRALEPIHAMGPMLESVNKAARLANVTTDPSITRALRVASEVSEHLRIAREAYEPLRVAIEATAPLRDSPLSALFGCPSNPFRSSAARDDVAARPQSGMPLLGYADPSKPPPLASPEAPPVQRSTDIAAPAPLELSPVAIPSEEARAVEAEARRDVQCPTDDVAGPPLALLDWPDGLRELAQVIGPERASEVASNGGGRSYTIPKTPTDTNPLAAYLEAEEWRLVTSTLGGRRLYIGRGVYRDLKKRRAMELIERGLSTREIARRAGCSERYVQRLRKEAAWTVN